MKKIVRLTESDLVRIVKRVINEQSDCSKLKKINPSMSPHSGAYAKGYIGEPNWEKKLEKVVTHKTMYQVNGDNLEALKLSSRCNATKTNTDVHTVTFTKDGNSITYLGVD